MNYIEIHIPHTNTSLNEILISELTDVGLEGFLEEDNSLKAYIPESTLSTELKQQIKSLIERHGVEPAFKQVPEENWNAKWEADFEPVVVNDQCVIRTTFHKPFNVPHEVIIEPKMAFGTGHHATTWLMANALFDMDLHDKSVLDVGCGTGVLAILARMLGAGYVEGVDIDEWSYQNSKENLALNDVSGPIEFKHGSILDVDSSRTFDIILANINRNVLMDEMKLYVRRLKQGGYLMLSGFFTQDVEKLNREAQNLNLSLVNQDSKNEWCRLLYEKN